MDYRRTSRYIINIATLVAMVLGSTELKELVPADSLAVIGGVAAIVNVILSFVRRTTPVPPTTEK